jgi:hypothetical protein
LKELKRKATILSPLQRKVEVERVAILLGQVYCKCRSSGVQPQSKGGGEEAREGRYAQVDGGGIDDTRIPSFLYQNPSIDLFLILQSGLNYFLS